MSNKYTHIPLIGECLARMVRMQTSMFDMPWPLSMNPNRNIDLLLATYEPTSIWISVSGGIDSDAAAI